jgi:ubiquinol-cytochrome c reductase cytochrome b/c1 subunit
MLVALMMGVSGELMCLWYSTYITEVKASLLFMKYNTQIGDILVRSHKMLVAVGFASVFFHMAKAIQANAYYGSRAGMWKSGMGILMMMFGISYMGCILPWTVLSPTLYTMVQTIVDTYLGGWAVFLLLGGEKIPYSILARTLIAHILLSVAGAGFLMYHIRLVHFGGSSVNKYMSWPTNERPNWMPDEIVKELYLLYIYFFIFFFLIYRKSASWGSTYLSLYKFYYGGATNWNNLPTSIEPEWYFWIFYFSLASAPSLSGGLLRALVLFLFLGLLPLVKDMQCMKSADTAEHSSLNIGLGFFFTTVFLIFFNRSKGAWWHVKFLDHALTSICVYEIMFTSINIELAIKLSRRQTAKKLKLRQ